MLPVEELYFTGSIGSIGANTIKPGVIPTPVGLMNL